MKRKMFPIQYVFVAMLISLVSTNCAKTDNNSAAELKLIRVAVLPNQNAIIMRAKYIPLLDYISKKIGIAYELQIPQSYSQLLGWFHHNKIDLALFGGVTYVKAQQQDQAVALVSRDIDGRFSSVVLVQNKNLAQSLKDLKGQTFSFGSKLSTSGHLMPRYFFKENQFSVEKVFNKVVYSNAHDLTAEWVRDGKVDAGVANSGVVNQMYTDGRLQQEDVRILWETPPYSDYVWAIQARIGIKTRNLIRDAFLSLIDDNDEHRKILRAVGAGYFLPASSTDFIRLGKVITELNL